MSTTLSCPSCSDPISDAHRFCPSCGKSLDLEDTPTGTAPRPRLPASRRADEERAGSGPRTPGGSGRRTPGGSPSVAGLSAAATQGRFLPGTLLVDRYRIVGLLGKGGMGEVYRADDLRLEQPVALKFIPPGLEADRERLERFYNEVRTARQVTHPAVCRVYDIGDVEGQHFLSMEFVDGENLASLQRRIGRLAADKALDIAKQLCAGVAAAHEKGVLHRDLKPENVMVDGQGKVRITDFGLAGLEDSIRGDDVRSGTPAYMSPEQLAGLEVTAKSDVYSLGLVLYELFTGRKAFEGKTYAELVRKHRDERPMDPSLLVPDIDPAVERTILRCVEKDAARRPASARTVSVLLGGGDPLAAAIAAGETPSPELVAAAGEAEGLRPAHALACLAVIIVGALALPFFLPSLQLLHNVPVEKAPAVLEDRARELIRRLGVSDPPVQFATGFDTDHDYFRRVRETDKSVDRWDALATGDPAAVSFWYRQSPRPMVSSLVRGHIEWGNPPIQASGMAGAHYDLRGRLLSFYAIPPQLETEAGPAAAPDWAPLFAEAQLDPQRFHPVTPAWTPPFYCDARAAWEETDPKRPETRLRVEAAAYRGRPASFLLVYPWTRPERMEPHRFGRGGKVGQVSFVILLCWLLAAGAFLAWRNVALGRGDRRGAFRTAVFVAVAGVVAWALNADHVATLQGELTLEARGAGGALLVATILWMFYLAIEPYVRRTRPHTLISWTRLLNGGVRDPLVGRDALIGMVWGVLNAFAFPTVLRLLPSWVGQPPPEPLIGYLEGLLGFRQLAASLVATVMDATLFATGALLLFLVLRLLFRRELLATIVLVAVLTLADATQMEEPAWLALPIALFIMGSYSFLLLRFGLLSAIAGFYTVNLLLALPLTTDLGSWMGGATVTVVAVAILLGLYAYSTSLPGHPRVKTIS
jgi:serine/threonine-protein kinase